MGVALRRGWVLMQQPVAQGWWLTAGLAVLMAAVDRLVDHGLLNQGHTGAHADLEFSLLAIGMLRLTRLQELSLCLFFLGLHYSNPHVIVDHQWGLAFAGELIRRCIFLGCLVWAVHLRTRLQDAQRSTLRLLRQTENKLVQSLQASALIHELRQPLSQLLLQLKRLQHRMEKQALSGPVLEQSLDGMLQSGRQIDGLIDAIHRLFGPAPKRFTRLDFCAIASFGLQALRPALEAAEVVVQVADLDQPAWIQGDAEHLQLAVGNLLRNALQALRHMPPPRQLRLQVDRAPEAVVLQVGDGGPGLPALDWRQLLLNSPSPSGMGLGLLIVRTIASNHGGRLILGRSEELGGALLSLSLPLASPGPDSAGSDTAPPAAPARRR